MARTYESLCYCTNLRRSAGAISDYYDAVLRPSGLGVAQYCLLVNLSRLGQANITHWSEQVGLERSTMVRNLKVLQERGLIESTEGHGKVFRLSDAGQSAVETAAPLWDRAQQKIEELLGTDAQAILRIGAKLQSL